MPHYLQRQLCVGRGGVYKKIGNSPGLAVGQHSVKCGGWRGSELLHGGPRFIRLKVFHHHTQGAIHILNDWAGSAV